MVADDHQIWRSGLRVDLGEGFAVIGEAAGKVSIGFRSEHPEIPWREITGMRHRLIHGYAEVRLDVVWAVVKNRLPKLLETLEPLLPPDEDGGST